VYMYMYIYICQAIENYLYAFRIIHNNTTDRLPYLGGIMLLTITCAD